MIYHEPSAPSGIDWLLDLWGEYAQRLKCEYIQPKGMALKMGQPVNYAIAIIQLPEPTKIPEAYFVGIIFSQNRVAYFTCEMGDNNTCCIGTILQDGKRGNEYWFDRVLTAQEFVEKAVSLYR